MSWEAVTWASKQRMKLPHEQLILLVLANCADPEGVAFAEWRGREHWWKYLVDRTRLSKSSLFRHINTLVDLQLCARDLVVLADGAKRPIIRLDLSKLFNIEEIEASHSHEWDQSHGETGEAGGADDAKFGSESSEVEGEKTPFVSQSHGETSPISGNAPFPIVGIQEDSKSVSKDSPLPPSGGTAALGFEDFKKAWLRPIERLSVAEKAFDHIPTTRRGEAIAAAKGYFAWVARQRKEPAIVSAQTFLRENSGWAQWLVYAPDASGFIASITTSHPLSSREGKAIVMLHEIAGCESALSSFMIRGSSVTYRLPVNARLLALADVAPKESWVVLSRQQAAAWETFLRDAVAVQVRKRLREDDRAPHPWPPKVDGTWSPVAPDTLMTSDDFEHMK